MPPFGPRSGRFVVWSRIFAANPAFFYFDAQFAYETLAVAFFAVVLLGAFRICSSDVDSPWTNVLILVVILAALIMTHHATSYVMAGVLTTLAITARVLRGRTGLSRVACRQLGVLAAFSVVGALTWLLTVARYTFSYLGPLLSAEVTGVKDLFASAGHSSRQLFATAVIPGYEIAGSYLAVAGSSDSIYGCSPACVAWTRDAIRGSLFCCSSVPGTSCRCLSSML